MKNFKNLKKIEDINDSYILEKKLGEGSFGTVYRAKKLETQTDCAIKVVNKGKLQSQPELPGMMMQELAIL